MEGGHCLQEHDIVVAFPGHILHIVSECGGQPRQQAVPMASARPPGSFHAITGNICADSLHPVHMHHFPGSNSVSACVNERSGTPQKDVQEAACDRGEH